MSNVEFNPINISTKEDLEHVLEKAQINPKESKWTKTVDALFEELRKNECRLGWKEGKLCRQVEVVNVDCFYTDDKGKHFKLVEEQQLLKGEGGTRIPKRRNLETLAEKVESGREEPSEAGIRGLEEELGISDVEIEDSGVEVKEKMSDTYKGIMGVYKVYHYNCQVPHDQYLPTYVEKQKDKTNYFTWKEIQ